ncbi:MAG: hypothetical protein GY854_08475 [Deltaproteobacteria bacterium]|nr:hypothetical protein [Deltaproteobacteria bacterium]
MNCREVNKYLDAHVDGELEAGLMLDLDNHLDDCDDCRAATLVKRRLKTELFALGQTRAPEHLRAQITSLARTRRRKKTIAVVAMGPLAAAAAVLLVLAMPKEKPSAEPVTAVVEDVVERHVRELPMEIEGPDPSHAASWFRGKVDFPVHGPNLNLKQASFQGARLSNVRAHQAAHMTYNLDGHRLSLMIFNPRTSVLRGGHRVQVGNREVLVGRRNGFNVVVFLDGDMAYALSSDLPQRRLLKIISDFKQ